MLHLDIEIRGRLVSYQHHFPRMSDGPHDPQIVGLLLYIRLSKDGLSPTVEILMMAGLTQAVKGAEVHPHPPPPLFDTYP